MTPAQQQIKQQSKASPPEAVQSAETISGFGKKPNVIVQRQLVCACDGGCPRCAPVQPKLETTPLVQRQVAGSRAAADGAIQCALRSHLPSQIVTIKIGKYEKRVIDYWSPPQPLRELEQRIDEAAGTAKWVGP